VAEELRIASLRRDGTLRKPVIIWSVRVGDDIYVRSAYGPEVAWLRGVKTRHEGRIIAGGVEKEATFEAADAAVNDQVDDVYRTKYRRHGAQYVNSVITPEARSTTVRIVPR
jgi:hypothetical protein